MKETGNRILKWYNENKRKLPWRKTKNPYFIWISEIMLQQTRVDQGLDYYLRFVERFPDIESLAKADEMEVLKYWQGLGYYSRARNLHFTAKYIFFELKGIFPDTYERILQLKGIGPYTAAAIASISFDLSYPVIDGNVMRVITRLIGIDDSINSAKGQNRIKENLNKIFIDHQAGDFNQAIMEFGALFCKPQNPQCENCILKNECVAFKSRRVNVLPKKIKSRPPQNLFIYYFVVFNKNDGIIYLRKRKTQGIWKNLYDFPSIDSEKKITVKQLLKKDEFSKLITDQLYEKGKGEIFKHQLTHKTIFAHFYPIILNDELKSYKQFGLSAVKFEMLRDYPVSRLIAKYIDDVFCKKFKVFY